jgi:hypothetical protein
MSKKAELVRAVIEMVGPDMKASVRSELRRLADKLERAEPTSATVPVAPEPDPFDDMP